MGIVIHYMEPIVVTLTKDKALQILLKYIEVSQSKGTYLITEADILKRCFDVLVHFAKDPEISVLKAKELLGIKIPPRITNMTIMYKVLFIKN